MTSNCCDILDEKAHMHYIGVRDGKKIEAEKSVIEIFVGEEERIGHINGLISHMCLIFYYTVQLVIPIICTKFHNP